MSDTSKNDLIKLSGLWLNESKAGVKYFSGSLGFGKLLIFKNSHKDKDSDPDYVLYLGPKPRSDQQDEPQEDEIIPF